MYITIESELYNKNGVVFKYFVDTDNMFWYCYEDICEYLELSEQKANQLYKYKITDKDKIVVKDKNNDYKNDVVIRDFISSEALRYLVIRNNERNNKLINAANNIEFADHSHVIYDEDDELKSRIDLLEKSVNDKNYEELIYQSYILSNSNSGRDMLDKLGIIDKDLENLLDDMRDDLFNYMNDEEEKEFREFMENNYDEAKRVMCKKHRKLKTESTCPDWLKDLI